MIVEQIRMVKMGILDCFLPSGVFTGRTGQPFLFKLAIGY
ncbi:MAG: hypothetical protein A4E47_01217 [Methanosaeta sp. PtaU1.Bin028]|nr:MAG: hypothetical protein A4E47_01217 [Methanosaeta sp. PtaU1.Bin028]